MISLTTSQTAALACAATHAQARHDGDASLIAHVLRMGNVLAAGWTDALEAVREHARVALHFHPDRIGTTDGMDEPGRAGALGQTVAERLLTSGIYRSQFETGLSNGSVSARAGGARDRWEHTLFGGAYQAEGVLPADRPKYGALDLMRHPDGPSPRFGSCYLVLEPQVSRRCTFSYLDSFQLPDERGTLEAFEPMLGALLAEVFARGFALGEPRLTVPRLVARLASGLPQPTNWDAAPARNLDHYIEAQVHGEVRLARDAEMLVCDPSFQNSPTGSTLEQIAASQGLALQWHAGSTLPLEQVPSDFRGATMPSLAARITKGAHLNAHTIGCAAAEVVRKPSAWVDRGTAAEVLQELKLLWHCLLKHGRPSAEM